MQQSYKCYLKIRYTDIAETFGIHFTFFSSKVQNDVQKQTNFSILDIGIIKNYNLFPKIYSVAKAEMK